MTRLILSTSNIMTVGLSIVRKPGSDNSNNELSSSLRSNFLAAQQDFSHRPPDDTTAEYSRRHTSAWTTRDASDYYIPTIDWSRSALAEERSQYDITLKLFYLPNADLKDRGNFANNAVEFVLKILGVNSIDLLIISFPGISFEGDCEWEADKRNSTQGNDEEEIATWTMLEHLYERQVVHKLGIAEFGSEKLARFLTRVKVRPEVDQINVKDCCNVPPALLQLAKQEKVELLTHNDSTKILPCDTLRQLLGQERGAGIIDEGKRGQDGIKGDVIPRWVVKYTAVVRDRGVIENKGYFVVAELLE